MLVHSLSYRPLSLSNESISFFFFFSEVPDELTRLPVCRTHFLLFFFSSSSSLVAEGARDRILPPCVVAEEILRGFEEGTFSPWINRLSAFSPAFQPLFPLESLLRNVEGGYSADLRISLDFARVNVCQLPEISVHASTNFSSSVSLLACCCFADTWLESGRVFYLS